MKEGQMRGERARTRARKEGDHGHVSLLDAFMVRGGEGPVAAARHPKSAVVHTDICFGYSKSTVCRVSYSPRQAQEQR